MTSRASPTGTSGRTTWMAPLAVRAISTGAGALIALALAGVMALIASMSPVRAAPSTWSSGQRSPAVVNEGADPVSGPEAADVSRPRAPVRSSARPAPERRKASRMAMTRGVWRYDKARLLGGSLCAAHDPTVPHPSRNIGLRSRPTYSEWMRRVRRAAAMDGAGDPSLTVRDPDLPCAGAS